MKRTPSLRVRPWTRVSCPNPNCRAAVTESGGCDGSTVVLTGGGGGGDGDAAAEGAADEVATEIGQGAADPVNSVGEAGVDGVVLADGAAAVVGGAAAGAGVYEIVYSGGGGGGAEAAAGAVEPVEGAAVTEEPPPMSGTGARAIAVPRVVHTTLLVRHMRPVSARSTTCVDAEWLLEPWR